MELVLGVLIGIMVVYITILLVAIVYHYRRGKKIRDGIDYIRNSFNTSEKLTELFDVLVKSVIFLVILIFIRHLVCM